MRRPGVDDVYRLAWRNVRRLPAPVGYGLFHLVGDAAWAVQRVTRSSTGVGQLRRNLAHLLPAGTGERVLCATTRAGMRSYMRYFYEAFALPGLRREQIVARVRPDVDPSAWEAISQGSIVIALPHMGNWDLVGAWACDELAQVLTVAERLEPADLFEQFVAFREGLGMRIIGQSKGEKVFERLVAAAQEGRYVIPLLADRDLSSSGIEAPLGGEPAHVAAGPAALAERLGVPLFTASVAYERLTGSRRRAAGGPWGVVLTIRPVPEPEGLTGREKVVAWTRAWVADLGPRIAEHAEDWHMLQPVFDADLDQERLARRRAREATADTAAREAAATAGPAPAGAATAGEGRA